MSSSVVFASLRIIGDAIDPSRISERLEMVATESHIKGGQRGSTGSWSSGYWALSTATRVHSVQLEHHLAWLISILHTKQAVLAALRDEGMNIDVFCFLNITEFNYGCTLSPVMLLQLAALGVAVGLDIYTPYEGATVEELGDALKCSGKE